MKNNLLLLAIVSGVLSTSLYATTESGYQPATVVSVESQATPSNNDGGDPSDAPLQSVVNSYDIDIRVGGTVYRASYDTAFDDLPSPFTPNHPVEVNLKSTSCMWNFPVMCGGDGYRESRRQQRRVPRSRKLALRGAARRTTSLAAPILYPQEVIEAGRPARPPFKSMWNKSRNERRHDKSLRSQDSFFSQARTTCRADPFSDRAVHHGSGIRSCSAMD